MRLADNLINLGRCDMTKKSRGRPSNSATSTPYPFTKKKKASERKPYDEVRYDNVGHFPISGEKLRCKKEGCSARTYVVCKKCKINLCFVVKSKNCFDEFHSK